MVSHAFPPLSLEEPQHSLVIEPDNTQLDEKDIISGSNIIVLCAGLVNVDSGTNLVTLVPDTAKNYSENTRSSRFPGFHVTITMSCAIHASPALKGASMWRIARRYPLACYAAQYIGDHARHNPDDMLDSSVLDVIYRPEKRKPLFSLLESLDLIKCGLYSTGMAEAAKKSSGSLSATTITDGSSEIDDSSEAD